MHSHIDQAIAVLQAGGIILYPTDTVWGLGCDATNPEAVAKIYALKQRNDSKALLVLLPNITQLRLYVDDIPPQVVDIIAAATRPTTIVYCPVHGFASNLIASDGSVAIRLPQHAFCQQLLTTFGKPIVSTSANLSGEPSPAYFADIAPQIIAGSDWVAPEHYQQQHPTSPSTILRIAPNGEIVTIRA